MAVAIVTGSCGLIGSDVVRHLARLGLTVVGIDNDMRRYFFGDVGSTARLAPALAKVVPDYHHLALDIRDLDGLEQCFRRYGENIQLVVHTAAQPSHDWAARDPLLDFSINAQGTINLLELTRRHAPEAVFAHCSTNKVYGDSPNLLPLTEDVLRYEIAPDHPYFEHGIDESMSIDASLHSVFGASKTAADIMVQEYGRYFGMKTTVFRFGCLTGPHHAAAQLHGFLAYLVHQATTEKRYSIFGFKGKQVRDNLHSDDVAKAIVEVFQSPECGAVYNLGGGRRLSCSVLEALGAVESLTRESVKIEILPEARRGDHQWWISDNRRFQQRYPGWGVSKDLTQCISEIIEYRKQTTIIDLAPDYVRSDQEVSHDNHDPAETGRRGIT